MVGGGVKGLVVAGVHLLGPVASHQLAPKADCHLLQLHLLCRHTMYEQAIRGDARTGTVKQTTPMSA